MVFNSTQACVTRSEPELRLEEGKVEYTQSYTYLGVTFKGSHSSYRQLPVLDFPVDMQPLVLV